MSESNFFTNKKQVTGEISVWAFPRTEWERDQAAKEGDNSPFKYELRTDSPYDDEAIKVCTDTITIRMPSGIDLLGKIIETLKEKKEHTKNIANIRIAALEEKMNSLLMLASPDNIGENKPIINLVDPIDPVDPVNEDDIPF